MMAEFWYGFLCGLVSGMILTMAITVFVLARLWRRKSDE